MSKFVDERLERAVEDAGATLDKRLEKLDQVSHDIKELERHLEGSGIRERIEFRFDGGTYAVGDPELGKEIGGGAAEETNELLIWEQVATQNRWRIMYLKTRREGCWGEVIPGLFSFEGEPEVVGHRPLIETPAEVRLRAGEALPDFVAALAALAAAATPRSRLH
jgi:hypothetical protein